MVRKPQGSTRMRLAANAYSALMYLLVIPLRLVAALFLPDLSRQLAARGQTDIITRQLDLLPDSEHRALFFCSSAGEYEQASPLIEKLKQQSGWSVIVFFFSTSGYEFAKARNESVPFFMSPLDTVWHWRCIWRAWKPTHAIIVRHELWPGFIFSLPSSTHRWLIDASPAEPGLLKGLLINAFDKVFLTLESKSSHANPNVVVAGDTKYDRALQRVDSTGAASLKTRFDSRMKLIVGSAWEPEIDIVLPELKTIGTESWQVILAPHSLAPSMLAKIEQDCATHGLSCQRFSAGDQLTADVIIVDSMGQLAVLYGVADIGIIGGALHNKIHNVLEAAAWGLAVAFGPRYHSQVEAINLVEKQLAKVINSQRELQSWWQDHQAGTTEAKRRQIRAEVESLAGASDLIWQQLVESAHP